MAAELNRMAAFQPVEIGIELVILVVTRLTARDVCAYVNRLVQRIEIERDVPGEERDVLVENICRWKGQQRRRCARTEAVGRGARTHPAECELADQVIGELPGHASLD